MQAASGGQKIKRKVSCVGCYGFFTAREGAMCKKTWREFCTEECLQKYNKPGTTRTDEQLKYAQNLLNSVEARTKAPSGLPSGVLRCAKRCALDTCQNQIKSMIQAVCVTCDGGALFYCSQGCAEKGKADSV
eukprot:1177828-Prorocentrum_minimum.AAC.3